MGRKMSDKIDKILEKVTQTQIAVAVMQGDVRKNCRDIEALQTNMDKALVPIIWFKGALKLLGIISLAAGAVKLFKEWT